MDVKQFPIPNSGRVNIVPTCRNSFDVECSGLNLHDHNLLMGFSCSMQGRFGEFRFEHAGIVHPKCRFDSDSADFVQHGPNDFSVTFPVKVLP